MDSTVTFLWLKLYREKKATYNTRHRPRREGPVGKNMKLSSLVVSVLWLERNKKVPGHFTMIKNLPSSLSKSDRKE